MAPQDQNDPENTPGSPDSTTPPPAPESNREPSPPDTAADEQPTQTVDTNPAYDPRLAAFEPTDTLTTASQSTSDTPSSIPEPQPEFTPMPSPQPKSRGKKWLIIGIIVAIGVLLLAAVAAAALWYNNPKKVMSDAVHNLATSRTMVSDGTVNIVHGEGDQQTKIDIKLASKVDNPSVAGQLDVDLAIQVGKEGPFTFTGAGLMSDTGNLYFKLDGLRESFDQYQERPEMRQIASQSPEVMKAVDDFIAKIDGTWVRIEQEKVRSMWESFDHAEAKQCYQAAYDELDRNDMQRQQLYDAYDQHQFITINQDSIETVNDVVTNRYKVGIDVPTFYDAADAFAATDFYKATATCEEKLFASLDRESELDDRAEDIKDLEKMTEKTNFEVWVSQLDHQLVRTAFDYSDDEGRISSTMNYRINQGVELKDPAQSLSLDELEQEIQNLQQALSGAMTAPATASGATADATAGDGRVADDGASSVLGARSDAQAVSTLETLVRIFN